MKCRKCGGKIRASDGYRNDIFSGITCDACEDMRTSPDVVQMQNYITKIAKFECGCAPSAGYMEELILEARSILNQKNL